MVEIRWHRAAVPGFLIGVIALAVTASTSAAGVRPWTPPPCADGPASVPGSAQRHGTATLGALRGAPWFRLDPALDVEGTLIGQRLTVGRNGARSDRSIALPPESFAAGPFGDLVLVGADDGTTSRVMTVDVARGCTTTIAVGRAVIRRATISPDRQAIVEARVDRSSRMDLGVWRRSLVDGGVRRILPSIAPDDRFGPTWSTELSWSAEGDRLMVQSCGAWACRTRIADVDGARLQIVDDPTLGPLVGMSRSRLVSALACRGLPCPIVAVDVASGRRDVLEPTGGAALVVGSGDGARVVVESFRAGDAAAKVREIGLDGTAVRDLGSLAPGQRLVADRDPAAGATDVPAGWLLLAPDGRLPDDAERATVALRSTADAHTVALDEVSR